MTSDLIPQSITDATTLIEVAEAFSEASQTVRTLESERKTISVPMNAALDELNAKVKQAKAPHLAVIDATEKALSDYRKLPEVQEGLAQLKALEKKNFKAAQDGDTSLVALIALNIETLKAKWPRSIPVSNGSIRFKEKLVIDEIDLLSLPQIFIVEVADEKRIKENIELLGSCDGVKFHYEYGVALYEDKSEQE